MGNKNTFVFTFEKGGLWDGDHPYSYIIIDNTLDWKFEKNLKVIVVIEEIENKKELRKIKNDNLYEGKWTATGKG